MVEAINGAMLPYGGIIDRSDLGAMRVWSRLLGAYQSEILIAVAVVGPAYDRVRDYLASR